MGGQLLLPICQLHSRVTYHIYIEKPQNWSFPPNNILDNMKWLRTIVSQRMISPFKITKNFCSLLKNSRSIKCHRSEEETLQRPASFILKRVNFNSFITAFPHKSLWGDSIWQARIVQKVSEFYKNLIFCESLTFAQCENVFSGWNNWSILSKM